MRLPTCWWDIPTDIVKRIEKTTEKVRSGKVPKSEIAREFGEIDTEMYERCIADHLEVPVEKIEEVPKDKFYEAEKHCIDEHLIGFMSELEHFGEPKPDLAWETALSILDAWVEEKKRNIVRELW